MQESGLPCENTAKESIPEKPVGRHGKKWQVRDCECIKTRDGFGAFPYNISFFMKVNGLIKKAVPHSTTHPGEVSQVTLWQGCEPVKVKTKHSF